MPTEEQLRAYRALQKAAERIGENNWNKGVYSVQYDRRGRVKETYTLTESHERVVRAMPLVLAGTITPEQAMAILWDPQVLKERLGD